MAASVLSAEQLSSRSRGRAALDNFSHGFAPGELTAVLGGAGSGKSLLIRLLAGLEQPRGGRILVDGIDVTRTTPRRRAFGIAREADQLFPQMTLAENVALPLRLRGVGRRQRAKLLEAMLDLCAVAEEAGRLPAEASPAAIERAKLARAFVGEPRVALLDEPFAAATALSPAAYVSVLRRVQSVLGTTVVMATQQGRMALALAGHVLVLRDGAVEQAGKPEEVFARPGDAATAGLFGEMNRLRGVVEQLEEDTVSVRLACGPLVEAARGGAGLESGKPCVVLLRPEAVAVAAASAAEMGFGALAARLVESQFYGESYLLRLLIGSGEEVLARRPALGGLRGLAPGRAAAIAWQPHQAFAFRG